MMWIWVMPRDQTRRFICNATWDRVRQLLLNISAIEFSLFCAIMDSNWFLLVEFEYVHQHNWPRIFRTALPRIPRRSHREKQQTKQPESNTSHQIYNFLIWIYYLNYACCFCFQRTPKHHAYMPTCLSASVFLHANSSAIVLIFNSFDMFIFQNYKKNHNRLSSIP